MDLHSEITSNDANHSFSTVAFLRLFNWVSRQRPSPKYASIFFLQIVKAQNVFFLISLLNVVRVSCTIFVPLQFIFTTEAMVSIQRITDFLIQEESEFIGKDTNVEKGTG